MALSAEVRLAPGKDSDKEGRLGGTVGCVPDAPSDFTVGGAHPTTFALCCFSIRTSAAWRRYAWPCHPLRVLCFPIVARDLG